MGTSFEDTLAGLGSRGLHATTSIPSSCSYRGDVSGAGWGVGAPGHGQGAHSSVLKFLASELEEEGWESERGHGGQ